MNRAEEERIDLCKRMVGCLPCLIVGRPNQLADYHHVVEGGRRLGHMHGYPMCLFHHRGHGNGIGPSYALERREFRAFFGAEKLLIKTADYAVEMAKSWQWPDHEMPFEAAEQIRTAHFHHRANGAGASG